MSLREYLKASEANASEQSTELPINEARLSKTTNLVLNALNRNATENGEFYLDDIRAIAAMLRSKCLAKTSDLDKNKIQSVSNALRDVEIACKR